ncbi:CLUMA_CG020236, isoform A [Clunio marinus]|uniref:CLUMA_CG020236, isoform A n=1 Tax=Clunio marinus TaxID=568069 RepID=A0A1J1J4C7_9DIPT|nr:CLUMA_CG020236, isoform A [Clunio marinus]
MLTEIITTTFEKLKTKSKFNFIFHHQNSVGNPFTMAQKRIANIVAQQQQLLYTLKTRNYNYMMMVMNIPKFLLT